MLPSGNTKQEADLNVAHENSPRRQKNKCVCARASESDLSESWGRPLPVLCRLLIRVGLYNKQMIVNIAVHLSVLQAYKCPTLSFHTCPMDEQVKKLCLLKISLSQ